MSLIEAIIMGFIQGLTEFLPVSSSGHLAIFKNVFHVNTDTGILFDVLLHLGTLVAIFIAYWKDIKELIVNGFGILGCWFYNAGMWFRNLFSKEKKTYKKVLSTPYRRFVMMVIISTIPTGIMGIVLEDVIGSAGEFLLVPGICLVVTACILYIADKLPGGGKNAETATYGDAVKVGIVQGIGTLPGVSRSGSTITACLACGFDKAFAVKYSFIMSIPAVLGAVVLEVKDGFGNIDNNLLVNYAIGTVIAGVVGYICIKTVLKLVQNNKFKYFAYYCFIVGIASVIGYFYL